MPFKTKLDFSNNRQVKQFPETITQLSGGTSFGVPFSALTTGPDLDTSGITATYYSIGSTFSGNSGTTTYYWGNSNMNLGNSTLSAITPSNSATTQNTGLVFTASSFTTIDGNTSATAYTGVSFNVIVTGMTDLGSGSYSGSILTNTLNILSAGTLDFTGRTIWVDVSGITRTEKLIISNNPVIGYVATCSNSEGLIDWQASSGSSSYWSASTGTNAIVLNNSDAIASGTLAIAEGSKTLGSGSASHVEGSGSTASGIASHGEGYYSVASQLGSHAEGVASLSSGQAAHAEGSSSTASGFASHAEGTQTTASGSESHSEGNQTTASGTASHTEGDLTTASAQASHAGGTRTLASGLNSFVHGSGSTASGISTIVLGSGVTGTTDNTVYVSSLNIKTVGSSAFANDIRIDSNGNLTTNTSDIRFKENINTLDSALSTINKLRGVSYQWKDRSAGGDSVKLGFIAQEIELVDPRLIFTNKVDGYMGVHIDGIIPLLVEAVKELSSGNFNTGNVYLETQTILAEDNDIQLNYSGNSQSAIGGGMKILHAMGTDISAELITDENGNWITNNTLIPKAINIPFYTPSSSNDNTGDEGNITRDNNFMYVKTSEGWKRSSLESF